MLFIPSSDMTFEEAQDYMKVYHATVNLLANAIVLFNARSKSCPLAADRNLYQLKALEANRTLELLSSKLSAFLYGTSQVRRPSAEEIATAQGLAEKLAKLAAADANAQAMAKLLADGVEAFNKVSGVA